MTREAPPPTADPTHLSFCLCMDVLEAQKLPTDSVIFLTHPDVPSVIGCKKTQKTLHRKRDRTTKKTCVEFVESATLELGHAAHANAA